MPIIKSAKKRVRVAKKASARNSRTKRSLKASVKAFASKKSDVNLRKAQSDIDKAVKKGVISKHKAARKKSQLAAAAKAAGIKPVKKSVAKKAPTKKPVAKSSVKKTAAKKATKK